MTDAQPNTTIDQLHAIASLLLRPKGRARARRAILDLVATERRRLSAYHQTRQATGKLGGRPRKKVTFPVEKVTFLSPKGELSDARSIDQDLSTKYLDQERETRAREALRFRSAHIYREFGRLDVHTWEIREMLRQLNGKGFDFDGFFLEADAALRESGEFRDDRWLIRRFKTATAHLRPARPEVAPPAPVRYYFDPVVPGCTHSPTCWTPVAHAVRSRCDARAAHA